MPDLSLNSLERSATAALQRSTNSAKIALFVLVKSFSAIRYAQSMKRSSKDSEARLFAVAETQGGFFTAKQAEDEGFDRTHHAYHARTGNWVREHRGVYPPDSVSHARTSRSNPLVSLV
jgi:hypothetical protein